MKSVIFFFAEAISTLVKYCFFVCFCKRSELCDTVNKQARLFGNNTVYLIKVTR